MKQTLISKLEEAIEKNFYIDGYFQVNGIIDDIEIDAYVEDFLLKHNAYNVKTHIVQAFDSPGYGCAVLSVAWVDEDGLHLETWLLEAY